ncbi:MAG: hypothetical protein EAY75_02475 [Bacteroidetes bacterium]|nr:MAG: hypothetical protein EAY75_02475 [Bacteroidota bacterium]
MNPAFFIWLKALGLYLVFMLPTLGIPIVFATALAYAALWGPPALLLFWLFIRVLQLFQPRPFTGFLLTLGFGLACCVAATLAATIQFSGGLNIGRHYVDNLYFTGAAPLAALISLLLSRSAIIAHFSHFLQPSQNEAAYNTI